MADAVFFNYVIQWTVSTSSRFIHENGPTWLGWFSCVICSSSNSIYHGTKDKKVIWYQNWTTWVIITASHLPKKPLKPIYQTFFSSAADAIPWLKGASIHHMLKMGACSSDDLAIWLLEIVQLTMMIWGLKHELEIVISRKCIFLNIWVVVGVKHGWGANSIYTPIIYVKKLGSEITSWEPDKNLW